MDAALRAALSTPDRARCLRDQLIDGWSIDQVGKRAGGPAPIATDEVDSIVRLVQSRVEMSLDRLLVPGASG